MPTDLHKPQVSPQPERAGVVGSPGLTCAVCGKPLPAGKPSGACSNKCRAALTRQRRAEARRAHDRELVALLDQAERLHQRAAEVMQAIRRRLASDHLTEV